MKRTPFRIIGYLLLGAFIMIQFIHPAGNDGEALSANDITHTVVVPGDVMDILKTSCFDCHSNHTNYPWYHMIQPVGLWLDDHVNEGKQELNFSEFNIYKPKRQLKKLKRIAKEVKEQGMPLSSYTFIHHDAVLTEAQAHRLMHWADSTSLIIHIPDSMKGGK